MADRVQLRWLSEADISDLYAIFSDDEVMRYWSCPAYTEFAQAEELLASIHVLFEQRSLYQWGVALAEDDRIIGSCTIYQVDEDNGRAEIGFALHREFWGKGLMGEAVDALLAYCFDELKLRRIEADVDPENLGSLRLLKSFGFQHEGLLRERYNIGGGIQDTAFLGLLSREFQRLAKH